MKAFIPLIQRYKWWVTLVSILGLFANILAILVPKISGRIIDHIKDSHDDVILLVCVAVGTFVVASVQIVCSTLFSEKVAVDLRHKLIDKVSNQTFGYIASSTPGRLLTILTSDIDAVKGVIAQGLIALLGAAVTLVGSAILLISINPKLGLQTLAIIPVLIGVFAMIFGKLGRLFQKGQENVEKINAVINESIIGAALIRVLNSVKTEVKKFAVINTQSKDNGLAIVKGISALIPVVTIVANIGTIIIIWFGGNQVMNGTLTVGDFSAFLGYSMLLIWPIFVLSFVGVTLSRGGVSLERINAVLNSPIEEGKGTFEGSISGDIEFKNVSLTYKDAENGEKTVLQNISFVIKAGTKNAIVGPTAAGKTQLFYLLSGLVVPTVGEILIDGRPVQEYKTESLLSQIGLVFQDSIMFNSSFRENIALSEDVPEEVLSKAIDTAELSDLIASWPRGLETLVSERGTTLSGGQKQRLMLARALAIEPKVLLLDDFTARVDRATESSILKNVGQNYASTTLVSITQKIEPVVSFDQIIVLMEGELVASGTHTELLTSSFEYRQIFESQQSTETLTTPEPRLKS